MKILEQWICDACGEIILSPKEGVVVWKNEGSKKHSFMILHKNLRNLNKQGCDNGKPFLQSSDLETFLGTEGLVYILSFFDPGHVHLPDYEERVDIRNFVEFIKRVQIPYYEEARLYWDNACADGFFSDLSQTYSFLPTTLKSLIKQYNV